MDITIPNSVYIDGQWATATWLAEIADPATGELIITATINQPTRVAALRMNMDLARRLRAMAMQQMPEPGCYDCRTTGQHLESLERTVTSLHEHQVLDARRVDKLERRLEELEAWQIAAAQDGDDDNTLFQIYDAVARRERAKAVGGA